MSASEKSSLDLAYDLAVDSYDPLLKRLDSIDGRLQTIMGFAATTMALVTSVGSSRQVSFRSYWFWGALVIFLLVIAFGTYARHAGGNVILNDPGKFLGDDWQCLESAEFKKYFVQFAGQHWNENNQLVTWRWKRSVEISIGYFFQVALLVAWLVAPHL